MKRLLLPDRIERTQAGFTIRVRFEERAAGEPKSMARMVVELRARGTSG